MPSPDILTVCSVAFAATFILLTFLAGTMWLLTIVFPERKKEFDQATLAAVAVAVESTYPGRKIVRIEREQ
ncbi:MAG TPA: hypothetical protein VMY18_03605 [Acidobacteriota bacterium]|jgi:uncharacterized membrane protein|nr:hypothetical protein [Acidobacteriota bacterium]